MTTTLAIKRIAIEDITPNPENPRRINDKHPSLPDLAKSITEIGLLQPIIVRPLGDLERDEITGYQILAGERRWRASKIAKLEEIDCIVRVCDDQTAFAVCVVENLQREDLHWLEEARGINAMISKGWSIETIAKELGKSVGWVHLRGKLAEISPAWQKAVEDPQHWSHTWPAAMLELISRFPKPAQDEILKGRGYDLEECKNAAALKSYLDKKFLHLLKTAPWDLNDGKLVMKAGACVSCAKRSSCQTSLFEESAGGDRCLDSVCWDGKQLAFTKERIIQVTTENPEIQLVRTTYLEDKEIKALGAKPADVLADGYLSAARPNEKGAKQVLVIDGDDAGKLKWMKKDAVQSHSRGTSSTGKKSTPKEQLEKLTLKRAAAIAEKFTKALERHKTNPFESSDTLIVLAAVFGAEAYDLVNANTPTPLAFAKMQKAPQEDLYNALWLKVRGSLCQEVLSYRATMSGVTWLSDLLGWQESLNGWIADARKEIPTPQALLKHIGEPEEIVIEKPKTKAAKAK